MPGTAPIKLPSELIHTLKDAELKLLVRAPGRGMVVAQAPHELESGSERLPKARRIVTLDRQAAAFLRPIEREGRHDGVTADLQGLSEPRHVGVAVTLFGEKMKRRPVVPYVVGAGRLPSRGVGNEPMREPGAFAEAGFCRFQRRCG